MASTKRTYTVTFEYEGTPVTYTGSKASAILQQFERYSKTGYPKALQITQNADDTDPGKIDYYNLKCICHLEATPSVEDVDPRDCLPDACIPDAGPANTIPAS